MLVDYSNIFRKLPLFLNPKVFKGGSIKKGAEYDHFSAANNDLL